MNETEGCALLGAVAVAAPPLAADVCLLWPRWRAR